jgi:hypothetical protein
MTSAMNDKWSKSPVTIQGNIEKKEKGEWRN